MKSFGLKSLLQERQIHFIDNLCPVDLFPYLKCLTTLDKEQIECTSKQNGDSRATQTLFERLYRRGDEVFSSFVRALRESGYEHLAMILDPLYQGKKLFFTVISASVSQRLSFLI